MTEQTEQIQTYPILPLTSGVVLPGMVFTIALESDEASVAAEAAGQSGQVLLVPRLDGRYAKVGVVAEILERGQLDGGPDVLVVHGMRRATIGSAVPATGRALWVQVEELPEAAITEAIQQLAREYRAVLENILLGRGQQRLAQRLASVTEPSEIADLAGYSSDLSATQKLEVLETVDLEQRLRLVLSYARETLAELTLRERIKTDVEEGMERTQREFLLRRQLDAVRKELGELDGDAEDGSADAYRAKVAARTLPEPVERALTREIDRFERTNEQSPEHGWIRTWIDTVLELPWGVESSDEVSLDEAAAILDADHEALTDVKERMLEHLAVRKLRAKRKVTAGHRSASTILALVGPPGVGKTSLGESVAKALGRKFVRVALGGVRDEAEIRGHRRTYVGAQPGRIVKALTEAGTENPVILLDEIDKVGSDYRGDPTSALLEVLDPAQNHTFRDHYLELELDLSKVLFLATANLVDTIPAPLLDRMELLRLDGYSEDEKVTIARRHLLAREIEGAGLAPDELEVTDAALERIVEQYTREAGVRNLERELRRLARKVASELARAGDAGPTRIDVDDVGRFLGRARFVPDPSDRPKVSGVSTGLAVTGAGGDVLLVESSSAKGAEGLTMTGQLGEVMKESAEIALSYVRSHAPQLGIEPSAFDGTRFHVHVPAGAVPKDGPSAGVTIVSALVSLLTNRPVRPEVAMTGEVTLQGRVLPIGGVRQKVLAAHRAGLDEVVLPKRNETDLEDVPESVREAMTFHIVEQIEEVLDVALAARDGHTERAA